jgi:hypothetical protein
MRRVVSVWILGLVVRVCRAFAVARVSLVNQNVSPLRAWNPRRSLAHAGCSNPRPISFRKLAVK